MNKSKKKQQLDMQTLKRLLSYLKQYKARFIFVLICILRERRGKRTGRPVFRDLNR